MHQDEILAEKIGAIISRRKVRDVYDAWFLLKNNAKADLRIIEKKLLYYKKKFDIKELKKIIDDLENAWEKELTQ